METRLIVLLIKFPNELFFNYPFHTLKLSPWVSVLSGGIPLLGTEAKE